jgi:hypothetical protein
MGLSRLMPSEGQVDFGRRVGIDRGFGGVLPERVTVGATAVAVIGATGGAGRVGRPVGGGVVGVKRLSRCGREVMVTPRRMKVMVPSGWSRLVQPLSWTAW